MRKAIGAVSVVVGCTLVALPLGGVNSAVAEAAPQVSAVSLPMAAKTSAKKKAVLRATPNASATARSAKASMTTTPSSPS